MTTKLIRESAKIYEFPLSARSIARGLRQEASPVAELAPQRVSKVAFGSGWYHEAAIQEAELPKA